MPAALLFHSILLLFVQKKLEGVYNRYNDAVEKGAAISNKEKPTSSSICVLSGLAPPEERSGWSSINKKVYFRACWDFILWPTSAEEIVEDMKEEEQKDKLSLKPFFNPMIHFLRQAIAGGRG